MDSEAAGGRQSPKPCARRGSADGDMEIAAGGRSGAHSTGCETPNRDRLGDEVGVTVSMRDVPASGRSTALRRVRPSTVPTSCGRRSVNQGVAPPAPVRRARSCLDETQRRPSTFVKNHRPAHPADQQHPRTSRWRPATIHLDLENAPAPLDSWRRRWTDPRLADSQEHLDRDAVGRNTPPTPLLGARRIRQDGAGGNNCSRTRISSA